MPAVYVSNGKWSFSRLPRANKQIQQFLRNEFVNYAILIPLYCYTNDRIIRNDTGRIKYVHLKRNECVRVNPMELKLTKAIKINTPNLKIVHYPN